MAPEGRYDTYEIETEVGKRRVEFDSYGILGPDVRVLVDGVNVAAVPLPKPEAPFHEVAFELDGHPLVGATWLPPEADALGSPIGFDVFENGVSVSGRDSLAEVRIARSTPRTRYPRSFSILDSVIGIAPWACTPGLIVGLGPRGAFGWPRTIALLTLLIGAIAIASVAGSRAWRVIRAREDLSELSRAGLGWIAVVGTYVVAALALIALIVTYAVVSDRP